jgi:signal transduction histidine kinase
MARRRRRTNEPGNLFRFFPRRETELDMRPFQVDNRWPVRAVLIAPDQSEIKRLAERLLRDVPASAMVWKRVASAAEAVRDRAAEVFLAAVESTPEEAGALVGEMRKTGCAAPILLLRRNSSPAEAEAIRAAGASEVLDLGMISPRELEKRLVEAAAKASDGSEDALCEVCQAADLGILRFGARGRLLRANGSPLLGGMEFGEGDPPRRLEDLFPAEVAGRLRGFRRSLLASRGKAPYRRIDAEIRPGQWLRFTVSLPAPGAADDGTAVAVVEDVSDAKKAERRLKGSRRRVRNLSHRLLEAMETERKRLALDIHDTIGASLSALRYSLERKLSHLPADHADGLRADIGRIEWMSKEIRRIQVGLRPCMLDDIGIGATLRWYAKQFGRNHPRIQVSLAVEAAESEIPQPLKIVLFRIVQDAMDNAARHSGGHGVSVRLESLGDRLRLRVGDNGTGMETETGAADEGGRGLARMRERAALSGGRFTIRSSEEGGVEVEVVWPRRTERKH